jgi:hypothetical protein
MSPFPAERHPGRGRVQGTQQAHAKTIHRAETIAVGSTAGNVAIRLYTVAMSDRPAQLRGAYQALGRGDLDPWIRLLDPRVVWRATEEPDVPDTPT